MFGSVEAPALLGAPPDRAARAAEARRGGFTEFVPLPFVHMEAPIALKGQARSGPTFREALLMHAVGRLALHPWITNVQASWVKLGVAGAQAALRLGRERPRRDAHERVDLPRGRRRARPGDAAGADGGAIRAIGRTPRQRTTLYGTPDPERTRASFGAPPLSEPVNPSVNDAEAAPPGAARPARACCGLAAEAAISEAARRDLVARCRSCPPGRRTRSHRIPVARSGAALAARAARSGGERVRRLR